MEEEIVDDGGAEQTVASEVEHASGLGTVLYFDRSPLAGCLSEIVLCIPVRTSVSLNGRQQEFYSRCVGKPFRFNRLPLF